MRIALDTNRLTDLFKGDAALAANDLWIAAVAKEHDLALVTRDRHFDKVPQLRRAMA